MNNQKNKTEEQDITKKYLRNIFEFVELFAIAACAILLIFTLFAQLTVVDGRSMEDTLQGGERLIISDFMYTPKAGDIVVIQSPELTDDLTNKPIVKRIIATEGQTVAIRHDGVYVDNVKLEETDGSLGYTVKLQSNGIKYNNQTFTVGEGEVFVMGDNRDISEDSRKFGCVDERCILGKVYLRISPFSRFGTVN